MTHALALLGAAVIAVWILTIFAALFAAAYIWIRDDIRAMKARNRPHCQVLAFRPTSSHRPRSRRRRPV